MEKMNKLYDEIQLSEEKIVSILDRLDEVAEKPKRKMRTSFTFRFAICVCLFLVAGGTVYGACRLLMPDKVASFFGEDKVADKFEQFVADDFECVIKENDTFKATYLGEVTGTNLSKDSSEVDSSKTYFVVALERKDDTVISRDDNLEVTPFIKGVEPWKANLWTMNASSSSFLQEGVLYYLYECEDLEIFANQGVYLGVVDGIPSEEQYCYEEKTGIISENPEYKGTNLLFELNLDVSKANPEKAEEYLKQLTKAEETPLEEGSVGDTFWEEFYKNREENGFQEVDNPEEMIANGTLMEGSKQELKPDEQGMLEVCYEDGTWYFYAEAVKKHGIDTRALYEDFNSEMVSFLVVRYEDGKYTCCRYLCK